MFKVMPALSALLLVGLVVPAIAQDAGTESQATVRLPVKIVAGRLLVYCEASTKTKRQAFHLLLDYDRPVGLELHNRASSGLELDQNGGELTLHFPGWNLKLDSRAQGDHGFLEEFTKLYSTELGDVPLVGAIGAHILSSYETTWDLAENALELSPAATPDTPPDPLPDGSFEIPISVVASRVWIGARIDDGPRGVLNLATSHYDSIIQDDVGRSLNRPAFDVGRVWIQDLCLTDGMAMRPGRLLGKHPERILGSLAINFLLNHRVTIDLPRRRAIVTQVRKPSFPESEFQYFRALAEERADAIAEWLRTNEGHRFAREAAERLLQMRLDDEAPEAEIAAALSQWDTTRLADLKCTEALRGMKMLMSQGRRDLALGLGTLGLRGGRSDRYPESVPQVHALMGEILLDQGDNQRAWEHLLSAAFGLPEDGRISYLLGTFYEREGRLERALSRFIQALLRPESGSSAVLALDSLRTRMPELNVDLIDAMLKGRTDNFTPAKSYQVPVDGKAPTRTVLVELFTNPELGRFMGGQWVSFAAGGAMTMEGLLAYCPKDRIAALTWHLGQPAPSAVMIESGLQRAAAEGLRPDVLLVAGGARGPGAGRSRDAEGLFETNRGLVDAALKEPSNLKISVDCTLKGLHLEGTVTVTGPADTQDRVHLVLAERGVLCPGKGLVVVHRMLARATLLNGNDGVAYKPVNGSMSIPFSLSLESIRTENEDFLDRYQERGQGVPPRMSSKIDPNQVTLVAYVRDRLTREVWQAHRHDVVPAPETR
ncbi:MAG TPA: hypothetical protein PKA37_01570 [Planctomycetota bacterium]|nr:hypothetical protein [Planctomycetota bacterium]